MEPISDPVSVRVARLNSEIIGKTKCDSLGIINREGLLDSLQVLYDECSIETLQKQDKNIEFFVKTYEKTIDFLKKARVNLSDFEIKNCIGRGHFGDVHVIVERNTRDVYAMKSIRKCDNLDQKKTSFIDERNIMAFTKSPWHTTLQYAFQDKTHLYFVMEFHPGGDLLALLYKEGGTFPESAATFYLAEILLGLQDLHKMGYVHRDIKPDNILLDSCGHVKLADFGSAAKVDSSGCVIEGPPVGTPDYIAPEILETMEVKQGKLVKYGESADMWSVGILAYEMTIGNTPFMGNSAATVYSKIMNHNGHLKFPPEALLSQAYVMFVKTLVVDRKHRLSMRQALEHPLFKNVHFNTLREQVPPFVPKISSLDDTSNFSDVPPRKKVPSIENFKRKTQFSGRNLPFVGFTYTPNFGPDFEPNFEKVKVKDEIVENMKKEMEKLQKSLSENEGVRKDNEFLQKKLDQKTRKLANVEGVRDELEKEMARVMAEFGSMKRTLELERKERTDLEKKALDLIKSAKIKWEAVEQRKIEALTYTINDQLSKIKKLTDTNKILDEQLQQAMQESKQAVSMVAVETLNRRSVAGMESRIAKVTQETQNTIVDLQGRLNEQFLQKAALENQISKLKNNELMLNLKLKTTEDNYSSLNSHVGETETLIKELEEKVVNLENECALLDHYKAENEDLKEKTLEINKKLRALESRCSDFEIENKKIDNLSVQLKELQTKLNQKDSEICELKLVQVELQKEKEKTQSLKKQLAETQSDISETQELRELRTKYWRVEKEMNNFKIDKRILERELKESESKNKELTEELHEMKGKLDEHKRIHEAALLEMNAINDSISMELIRLKEIEKSLQDKLTTETRIREESKAIVAELKGLSNGKEEKIRSLNAEIDILKSHLSKIENEKELVDGKLENANKKNVELRNKIDEITMENSNMQLNLDALREACSLLESQVKEYEKINVSLTAKHSALNDNIEKLVMELCEAKNRIQEAERVAKEEKNIHAHVLKETTNLENNIQFLRSEMAAYKKRADYYKEYSNTVLNQLADAEEKISELESSEQMYKRKIEDLKQESRQLKEELSEWLTQLHKCREVNYKLNHQLSEFKENQRNLNEKIYDLDALLQEKTLYYKEREVKSEATIKQQIKLIDFLQSKIDESQSKKKSFHLFGSSKKENVSPINLPLNYKDLEVELQKERASNKALQEEIYRLKAENAQKLNGDVAKQLAKVGRTKSEIVSPKTKVVMQKLVQSPSTFKEKETVERMRHNIPHRYEKKLCPKNQKCAHCNETITFRRFMHVCTECDVRVHYNCSSSLPNYCGIPLEFVEHYKSTRDKTVEKENGKIDVVNVEGWIKVAESNSWLKRYAVLSNTTLKIYTECPKNSTAKLLQSFELKTENSHGKVIMEPLLSEIDVPVAKSDLKFLIKIEVAQNTTCWPTQCLIFLALSTDDKEMWYKSLQELLQNKDKSYIETVMSIPEDLSVNCVVDLTEGMRAVGTDKGLYCQYNDDLLPIEGFTKVHNIIIVKPTNSVVMIVNPKNIVITCDLNHLMNVTQCTAGFAKPTLKYDVVNIANLNGFHLLETCKKGKHKMFCVATAKQLVIVGYDEKKKEFVPLKVLDTAEPTGACLFTEHSIIVGADKFFEIDLATFKAEEFVDTSSPRWKRVMKCFDKVYPLNVVQISENPKEYLVAFNEFSIFVDEYGSPSRSGEWLSTHLPRGISYIKPLLYKVEFNAVEIHKVTDRTCQSEDEDEEPTHENFLRFQLDKFQFVGTSKIGIYLCHDGFVKLVQGKKALGCEDSSICETDNESDRFSFSSSMVRSLDGYVDDENVEKQKEKCVTFAQTSF